MLYIYIYMYSAHNIIYYHCTGALLDHFSSDQHQYHRELQLSSGTQSQSASEVETEDSYVGRYHLQMAADFEQMYEALGADISQSEGDREGVDSDTDAQPDSDVVVDPRASKLIGLSDTHQLVGQDLLDVPVGDDEVTEETGEVRKDVEEGEVSDSSEETARDKVSYVHTHTHTHTHTHRVCSDVHVCTLYMYTCNNGQWPQT